MIRIMTVENHTSLFVKETQVQPEQRVWQRNVQPLQVWRERIKALTPRDSNTLGWRRGRTGVTAPTLL